MSKSVKCHYFNAFSNINISIICGGFMPGKFPYIKKGGHTLLTFIILVVQEVLTPQTQRLHSLMQVLNLSKNICRLTDLST